MHTGEVLVDDDGDLFGKHVVVAARIGAHRPGRRDPRVVARAPDRGTTRRHLLRATRARSSCGASSASRRCGPSIGSSSSPPADSRRSTTALVAFPAMRRARYLAAGLPRCSPWRSLAAGCGSEQQRLERGRVVDDDDGGRRDAERVPGRRLRGHDHGREEGRQRAPGHVDGELRRPTSRRTTSTCTGASTRPIR